MCEMFTKASAQKMQPTRVKVYLSESQSLLSFSMSLNFIVTLSSASSSYWNLVSSFLDSGKSGNKSWLSHALADLKWATLPVGWEQILSPTLAKIPLKYASRLRHSASRRSAAKVVPWRLGSFKNWQSDNFPSSTSLHRSEEQREIIKVYI